MKRIAILFILSLNFVSVSSQKIVTDLTYLVHEPAQRTAKTPVLIMLHGYGSNEADLFDLSKALDPAFIVFSVRAPHPAGSGYAWYGLEFLPDQQFRYEYREAKKSREQVLSFISKACVAYGVDSSQVFLIGFSQGAILSYDMALAAPKKIKGVLALSGRMMEETKAMKTNDAQLAAVKFFIAHGASDNVINIAEAEKANAFLKSKKVTDLTYTSYEMPHSLSGKEVNDIKRWLTKAVHPPRDQPQKQAK